MNNKIIIPLFTIFFYIMPIGMETRKFHSNNKPFWYLEKTIIVPEKAKAAQENITRKNEDYYISSICLDPSEKFLAIADCDRQIHIMDIETGTKLISHRFDDDINSICFDHSGEKLAILLYTPETIFFDIQYDESKKVVGCSLKNSQKHNEELSSIFFDTNNKALGIKSNIVHKKIEIIDLSTNQKQISFKYNEWIQIIAASRSKKYIATGSGTSRARLFDTQQEREIRSFELQGLVTALAFNKFEKLIAIASNDPVVHIFDLQKRDPIDPIATLPHKKYVSTLCFGSTGKTLATGSYDGKVRIFKESKTKYAV